MWQDPLYWTRAYGSQRQLKVTPDSDGRYVCFEAGPPDQSNFATIHKAEAVALADAILNFYGLAPFVAEPEPEIENGGQVIEVQPGSSITIKVGE